jgi:hypothetical protein
MAYGRIRKGLESSITEGVNAGTIDRKKHAAALAAVRKMADALDRAQDDATAFKTVTPKAYMEYLDALGMVPNGKNAPKVEKPKPKAKLAAFTGGAKFSKASHG